MKIINEKIKASFGGDDSKAAVVINVKGKLNSKQVKRKLYERMSGLINSSRVPSIMLRDGGDKIVFLFKYKDDDFHPDYGCEIARKCIKYFMKSACEADRQTEQSEDSENALKKGKTWVQNHVGKVDLNRVVGRVADRLNGISDYYDYDAVEENAEESEPVIQEEEVHSDPAEPDVSPDEGTHKETAVQEQGEVMNPDTGNDISRAPVRQNNSPVVIAGTDWNTAGLNKNSAVEETYINRRDIRKNTCIETLFTVEVRNFERGIIPDVI